MGNRGYNMLKPFLQGLQLRLVTSTGAHLVEIPSRFPPFQPSRNDEKSWLQILLCDLICQSTLVMAGQPTHPKRVSPQKEGCHEGLIKGNQWFF